MSLQVLEGGQNGLTQNDILQVICDDWGYPPTSSRIQNMVFRRINRSIRDIHLRIPTWRNLRVVGAEVLVRAGQSEYDPRRAVIDGGWGWDTCVEVGDVVLPGFDTRPLERLTLEDFRQRSQILDNQGSPTAIVPIDPRRVMIHPAPSMDSTGYGDYWCELPSLVSATARLEWPRQLDEAILRGTEYHTAKARMRENPRALREYRDQFYEAILAIEAWDKAQQVRPLQAKVTRAMRSRRLIPRDNSTDMGWRR